MRGGRIEVDARIHLGKTEPWFVFESGTGAPLRRGCAMLQTLLGPYYTLIVCFDPL